MVGKYFPIYIAHEIHTRAWMIEQTNMRDRCIFSQNYFALGLPRVWNKNNSFNQNNCWFLFVQSVFFT